MRNQNSEFRIHVSSPRNDYVSDRIFIVMLHIHPASYDVILIERISYT
jgi:hypothetical protein